jgi:hypothetical protein
VVIGKVIHSGGAGRLASFGCGRYSRVIPITT